MPLQTKIDGLHVQTQYLRGYCKLTWPRATYALGPGGNAVDKFAYIAVAIVLALSVTSTFAQQGNPDSPSNNPSSPQNNTDADQSGGKNATYDSDGTYNGYTGAADEGTGVDILDPDGNHIGHTHGE